MAHGGWGGGGEMSAHRGLVATLCALDGGGTVPAARRRREGQWERSDHKGPDAIEDRSNL